MSGQQNQIPYPTKSALKNYYIESTLPPYVLNKRYNDKPLPKTREFYKNDAFIWNNPYRASRKSYKYYHKQQEEYKPIEEKLKRQEVEEKEKAEQERIQTLKVSRVEDRNRLHTRRSQRTRLQKTIFGDSSQGLTSTYSSKKEFKQKTQLKSWETQETQAGNDADAIVQGMIKSAILKGRQSRLQQLKQRRAQIQNLIKKSGQSLKFASTRPITAANDSQARASKQL